ncbi:hypothetical protein [Devosia ginsengisoli]|uniref:hypothetical protein n=1 Tax=Devosia ginsengisoli TaxID=400770 RepID=UPI0026EC561E|nr:hypothetical protein [Devosia ginsengisoli]MCR6671469.1 hypothetical protein [Devosia ginsengisoli]
MNIPPPPAGFVLDNTVTGNSPRSSSSPAQPSGAVLRPLGMEDDQNGYWDAKNMGNGYGQSFIIRNGVKTWVSDSQMREIIANGGRVLDNFTGVPKGTDRVMAPTAGLPTMEQAIAQQGGQQPAPPPGFVLERATSGPQEGAYADALADASSRSQFFQGGPDPRSRYNIALRKVREQFPNMSDEMWAEYSSKFLGPYGLQDLGQQAQTLGFGDEIKAAMGAFGSQVGQWVGGHGPGYGEAYDANYELEQARLELGRKQQGGLGTAMEVVGGLATLGPARTALGAVAAPVVQTGSRIGQVAKAAPPVLGGGYAYGFGSTDGDLAQRNMGGLVGAGMSATAGVAAPLAGKVIQGTARRVAQVPVNMANRQAMQQAIQTAPSAATIKGTSQAAYKAAERTGVEIGPQAMQILLHDMTNLARLNGLIMPSGKLSTAYPKVAHALRSVREYAQGPVSIEQAQTLLKSIRAAQKSADPDEARLGMQMANAFEDFFDSLPPSAFSKNGQKASEAVQQWAKGRTEWARSKRTQAIEDIITDARFAKGGFSAGLRSGFASMLKAKNAKKRRGFSQADLDAIERFVEGGPIQELLERLGSGAGLPGGVLGGLTGGPIGAVAVPVAGGVARRLTNRNARNAAQALRAQVATPGGVPVQALPPPLPLPRGLGFQGSQAVLNSSGDLRNGLLVRPL